MLLASCSRQISSSCPTFNKPNGDKHFASVGKLKKAKPAKANKLHHPEPATATKVTTPGTATTAKITTLETATTAQITTPETIPPIEAGSIPPVNALPTNPKPRVNHPIAPQLSSVPVNDQLLNATASVDGAPQVGHSPYQTAMQQTTHKAIRDKVAPQKLTLKNILKAKKVLREQRKAHTEKANSSTNNTLAILSLVFGGTAFLMVFLYALTGLLAIAGIVCGIIALAKGQNKTMSILGIVLGGIVLILTLILTIALLAL